ncbi:phosphoribosyltransferase [Mycobacterium sp. IS-1742]|uniref:ComF family protein n=1 Tax=Mycobacterium sp. IS-1742 TaxID=1772285 RepID=UPI000740008F|nr:ComF family protein [Mycobacterium sp. IS-1742]KUI23854.1 phosphoribosyltransferase [Mycobacterium sp. IS-1742]
MLDLVLPLECGGCGRPSTRWCGQCAAALTVRADEPHLVGPRLDPGVPVFSLGRYAGSRRRAILGLKERGRADLIAPLAHALGEGLAHLTEWGILDRRATLVPAPTRRIAARRRGGDPVTRIARGASPHVVQALRSRALTRDSVGLSVPDRQRNVADRIRLVRPVDGPVVLVDDIVTTGATASESVRVLQTAGASVSAVLTLAHA